MYLKYGPKCCTSGEKYKFELKNLSDKITRAKVENFIKTVTEMLEKRFKNFKKKSQRGAPPFPPPLTLQICSANFHVCRAPRGIPRYAWGDLRGRKMIGKEGGNGSQS